MAGPDEMRTTINSMLEYLRERDGLSIEQPPSWPFGLRVQDVVSDLPTHPTKTYDKRPLAWIKQLVIHHVGVDRGRPTSPETIARYHVRHNDWAGIGYHYYIRKSGLVQITQHLETISAHCYGNCNRISVGICLEGSFVEGRVPTDEQLSATRMLNWYLVQLLRLGHDPKTVIFPHRLVTDKTSCPGVTAMWFHQVIPQAMRP